MAVFCQLKEAWRARMWMSTGYALGTVEERGKTEGPGVVDCERLGEA